MDTNYTEQLAWYENTVKPYTVRPITIKTRAWHASATKPLPSTKQPKLVKKPRNPNDNNRISTVNGHEHNQATCNDAKAEQPAIWTTNMEANCERQEKRSSLLESQTAIDTDDSLEGSKQRDQHLIYLHASSQEPMMSNLVAEKLQIRSPILRTMSEDTMYFDAANDWESGISVPATAIETDDNTSNISSHIPHQQMIEERLSLFNQRSFIPNQLESIYADLNKQDILLVMPSGPARDMCYLLPSILQKPSHLITIVIVTSYTSLQEKDANPSYNSDHVQSTFVSKFRASKRHWMLSSQFRQAILDTTLHESMVFLLTFDDFSKCKSEIQHLHLCNRLARIVLEDAHCFSQWGTDFHFGYLKIAEKLRGMYPNTPITALTAISNERVLADIMNSLQMPESTTWVFKRSILL